MLVTLRDLRVKFFVVGKLQCLYWPMLIPHFKECFREIR